MQGPLVLGSIGYFTQVEIVRQRVEQLTTRTTQIARAYGMLTNYKNLPISDDANEQEMRKALAASDGLRRGWNGWM